MAIFSSPWTGFEVRFVFKKPLMEFPLCQSASQLSHGDGWFFMVSCRTCVTLVFWGPPFSPSVIFNCEKISCCILMLPRPEIYHKEGIPWSYKRDQSNSIPQLPGEPFLNFSIKSWQSLAMVLVAFIISQTIGSTLNCMVAFLGWFLNMWMVVMIALYIGEVNTTFQSISLATGWEASHCMRPAGCSSGSIRDASF